MDHDRASRRDFLTQAGGGFGAVALSWLLGEAAAAPEGGGHGGKGGVSPGADPLSPKPPHFAARAKRVISLFMHGGPSHLETFDPKPTLQRLSGTPVPESFGVVETKRNVGKNALLGTKRSFARHGQSGIEVSDLLPNLAGCVDDLAVIRSCWADSVDHAQAIYQMSTGSILMGRPCLGSWTCYGLGTENANLPAFVVLPDPTLETKGGSSLYGAGFLPQSYLGSMVHGGSVGIRNLKPPDGITLESRRRTIGLLGQINARQLEARGGDPELEARIRVYELAYRMQSAAPEAIDLASESPETRELYGLNDADTADFGGRCLLARRLVERGVRFVQVISGDIEGWDAHNDIEANHIAMCKSIDKPVAALLRDLKRRGLLEETLVIWGGEFGRTPMSEGSSGRDHHPHGFTMWMAGGGVRGGIVHGSTDAIGLRAEVDRVHVRDIHATILHLLGLDHEKLVFSVDGREERLTGTAGRVIRPILA